MKILQIIVLIIAVYTIDCRDDYDGYEDLDSTAGEPEGLHSAEIDPEQEKTILLIQDSMDEDNADHFYSNKTGHIIPRAGTSETKIQRLEQKLQTMQANLTNANSRLSMELQTFKDNLTDANLNQNIEFQTLIDNLTNANLNQNIEFQTLIDNLTDANSNQNIEFQTLKVNLTNTNLKLNMEFQSMRDNLFFDSMSNIVSKLDTLMKRCQGVGFFHAPGSSRCYKFYGDKSRSWSEGKGKCQQDGLVLAETDNPIPLRKYLVQTYGQQTTANAWLGARATGSYFKWERSGRQISNTDSLWWTKPTGNYLSTSRCLLLLGHNNHLSYKPNQPYDPSTCTSKCFTLCEDV